MSRYLRWLPSRKWLVLPPVLLGISTLAFFASREQGLPREEVQERTISVQVEKVTPRPLQPFAVGYGTARPSRRWTAVSEVQGRITHLHPDLDSGHLVDQGEELIRIDDADYQLRRSQRQADYEAAEARVAELQAGQAADEKSLVIEETLLEVSQSELTRFLLLRDNRAIAESEYERAHETFLRQTQSVQGLRNALSLYPSKIASARASVAVAQSRLEEARRDIDRAVIRSPFAGRLAGVSLELDQFVSAGERLFEIRDSGVVEVEAQFSLAQLDRLMPHNNTSYSQNRWESIQSLASLSAEIIVRSGNVRLAYRGRPIRYSEQVNPQTRTRGIVIQVENRVAGENMVDSDKSLVSTRADSRAAAPHLLAGAFCEVNLQGPSIQVLASVPRTALDGDSVYVVVDEDGNSRLRRRTVSRGATLGDRITITDGLQDGDLIAIQPPLPAIDGQLVEPVWPAGSTDQATDAPIRPLQSDTPSDGTRSLP